MNEVRDFEDDLRAMLAEVEAAATPDADFADRLIDTTTRPVDTAGRLAPRRVRWLPPLLVAAAVVAMAVAAALIVSGSGRHHQQPPAHTQTAPKPPPPVSVPGFGVRAAYFRDPEHGYALGNVPCNNKPKHCATLLRTDDGGASWVKLSVPKGITPVDDVGSQSGGSCGTNGNVYGPCVDQVLFADAEHGYLWSFHSVYWTTDGGHTWRDAHSRALTIVLVGDQVVRARPLHDCSAPCQYHLEASSIGSATWHNVTPVPTLLNVDLQAAHGVAYVGAFDDASNNGQNYSLYRSTDGTSWRQVPSLGARCSSVLALAPDGTAVISCVNKGRVTLRVLASGSNQAGPTRQLPAGNWQATSVTAWSAKDLSVFLMPNDSSVATPPLRQYNSTDGGATWQPAGLREGWQVLDATHGYRLAGSYTAGFTMQVTADRGATYSTLRF